MYKFEYVVTDENGKVFEFSKSGSSDTVLKRNMKSDILEFCKKKRIIGEISVENTILYDEEYVDSDDYELVVSETEIDAA